MKAGEEVIDNQTNWKQVFIFDRYGNRNLDENETTTFPKNCLDGMTSIVCEEDRKIFNPSINTLSNRINLSENYVFDSAGNIISDPQSRTFSYDAENRQISVRDMYDNTIGQYQYDGDGKRIKKYVPSSAETTIFIYDAAGKLIAEYSTITVPVNDSKTQYITTDYLGSPRIKTDKNGQIISRTDFLAYGEELDIGVWRTEGLGYGESKIRNKFTGKERDDEIGLDFFHARYYSSDVGRFTSVDPINITNDRISDPQQLNLYSYVRNSPTVFVDPDGRDVHIAIGTVAVGTTTIRIISSKDGQPTTMQVPVYRMVVWDDVNGTKNMSTYHVTRDAPVMDPNNPTNEPWISENTPLIGSILGGKTTYNVINTAFEPAENGEGVYQLVGVEKYPEGTDLDAFVLFNQQGGRALAAEPNESPARKNKDVATGVMIHVGGNFTALNSPATRQMGSLGCFGVGGGNEGMKNFAADVKKRQQLNKKAKKGDKINLTIGKRNNVKWRWELNQDGSEVK